MDAKFHAEDPLVVSGPKHSSKQSKKSPAQRCKRPQKKWKASGKAVDKDEASLFIEVVRRYQLTILDEAMHRNTIVYLETGCGKTLIAILLIKKLAHQFRGEQRKFSALFLAPTVYLINQQAEVLKINTDLKVDSFHGAKGVDHWNGSMWQTHYQDNEVLVMTPQVLLDALRHGFLKLESFDLLIMDECHRAQKNHAYAKIMSGYYHRMTSMKPKVFGMTASPVTKKGVSSMMDSAEQMQRLEALLDCKVYTLEDRLELESFVPTPNQKIKQYEDALFCHDAILTKLEVIKEQCETYGDCIMTDNGRPLYKDDRELAEKLTKKIRKLHGSLVYCLQELGLRCAYEATICLQRKMASDSSFEAEHVAVKVLKKKFLEESSKLFVDSISEGSFPMKSTLEDVAVDVQMGLLTPKVLVLIECLLEYKDMEELRCIVFVERVITAMVLSKLINSLSCLSSIKSEFLTGMKASLDVMCKKQQQSTMDQFRSGKTKVLVATDVAEEGLDVQSCSSVIRFDLPKSVRSFIQSRGRARQPGSDYVIFLKANDQMQKDELSYIMKSEMSMRAQALNRMHHPVVPDCHSAEEVEGYEVESTGASVRPDSSISLLTRFCTNLPGDRYYRPQPEYSFEHVDGKEGWYVCQLIMPPNAPFRDLLGPPKRSRSLAKQFVCLEACKKLHMMGQLTDHLIPVNEAEVSEEEEIMNASCKNVDGIGTKKRKELHSTTSTDALGGNWIKSKSNIVLQAYVVCFTVRPEEEAAYCNFVFLVSTAIDKEIANTKIPLYLTNNRVATAEISVGGEYMLTATQLGQAKAYQELVFNGMFGRLMRHPKRSELKTILLGKMKNLLDSSSAFDEFWDPSLMYLILPLLPGHVEESDVIPIDWKSVEDCAATARSFAALHANAIRSCNIGNDPLPLDADVLQMACGVKAISEIEGNAVLTIHTGKIYSVVEVLKENNANCTFLGLHDAESTEYNTYSSYFKWKYGRVLNVPQQPLLQVKQSHRLHNLLREQKDASSTKLKVPEKKAIFVELPPELCLLIGVSNAFIQSLYLIPSVLHRFNALLLADQLRRHIIQAMPQCVSIKASVIMEALTTLRCLEGFSSESLETLGDSFLKYAVSRYLFLVYDKKHEGQLSARRSRAICNEKLHRLAISKELSGYIRDEPFHPEYWSCPGMISNKSVVCKCNLENLVLNDNDEKCELAEGSASTVFRIGKTCSKGHRWICSKTVSDVVESLIGAFIVCGSPAGGSMASSGPALGFMKWLGMDVDFDLVLYKDAREHAFVHPEVLRGINLVGLEARLNYSFSNKALLVEAITHASQQDASLHDSYGGYCYQRLEFLGDAVLDYLISHHLFFTHPGLSPGVLSDLRSAAVNNECFARSAVKHNLQRYLRHGSGELLAQITEFVKCVQMEGNDYESFGWEGVHGPKVLGDLVESIAGAILVDSGFDLETVWDCMKCILSPIVTPTTLPLQPVRELHELSQVERFFFMWKETGRRGKLAFATAEFECGGEVIKQTGTGRHQKVAKKDAAKQLLAVLRKKGIVHPRRGPSAADCPDTRYVPCPDTPTKSETGSIGEKRPCSACASDERASDKKKQRLSLESAEKCQSSACASIDENVFDSKSWMFSAELENSGVIFVQDVMSEEVRIPMKGNKDHVTMDKKQEQPFRSQTPVEHTIERDELMLFSTSLLEKGGGRCKLNEYCLKKKWKGPTYALSTENHNDISKRFTFSVKVEGHPLGPFSAIGDAKSSKKMAMDSAAVSALQALIEQDGNFTVCGEAVAGKVSQLLP